MNTNRSSQAPQTTDSYPRSEEIYILATSNDLLKLDKEFFKSNLTIGINQSYIRAEQVGEQLTYWVCLDEFFRFFFWCHGDSSPDTYKWIPKSYRCDHRINNLIKACRKDCIRMFQPRKWTGTFRGSLSPPILDDVHYTIFSAVSLAVLLGAKRIKLRGVSLGGKYVDETLKMKRDSFYEQVRNIFVGTIRPSLRQRGIELTNETKISRLDLPFA